MSRILITGSSGYKAAVLIPKLMNLGHEIIGIDIFPCEWQSTYLGKGIFHSIRGDIRNIDLIKKELNGIDIIIHLACISNDPSFDLDPELGKSINYDAFLPLVKAAKDSGVKRFIYASSSSVYGINSEPNVIEDLALEPLTDYSKYKALCEEILFNERAPGFEAIIIRPATVCGYSPAIRLDLCVHILTMAALRNKEIKVFGGHQYRPNIHIEDITNAYLKLLEAPTALVDGQIFNCGFQNLTISDTATMIQNLIPDVSIVTTPTNDNRSYHVSSEKISRLLDFYPIRSIGSAVMELKAAYESGRIPDPDNDKYYTIKRMKGFK